MKKTAAVTGILVTLIFNNVHCTLVTKPSHAAAKIGDFVIMRCSSSSSYAHEPCGGIEWKYFKVKSPSGTYITDNATVIPSVASHISIINSSAGNCHIKINATNATAGKYLCAHSTEEADAQLITLDPKVSEQSCGNIPTVLECSVRYYGNWAPTVQWMKTSGDSWEIVASNDSETSKNPVSSTITIGTTEQFKCNVRVFEPGKPNTLIFDWMSRPYNCIYPSSEDPRAYNKGIGVGFAICLAIFCLIGIAFLIFKRWQRKCIKGKGINPPAEDL